MPGNTITLANGLFEKEITTKRRASRAPHCLFIKQPHFTQESHDIQPDVTICSYNICPQRGRIMPYCAMPHAELAAWFDDILLSLGVKKAEEGKVIISKRQPRPAAPKDNSPA